MIDAIKYRKGKGFMWMNGRAVPTTIAVFPKDWEYAEFLNGEYEYPTNPGDRRLVMDMWSRRRDAPNFSIDHLERIKFLIAYTTRDIQANYADNIRQKHINDIFIKKTFDSMPDNIDDSLFAQFTAITVGNLAHLTFLVPKRYRDKAEILLFKHREWVDRLLKCYNDDE